MSGNLSPLDAERIGRDLGTHRIGARVEVHDRIASTSDRALEAGADRGDEGLVVLAEEQTSGRGSRGRSWSAPAGRSILMSALVFPEGPLAGPPWLTVLGAVAAAEVVEWAVGREARIKWPNDVRVGGRKVAGVLVERRGGTVVGIGLNVEQSESDFPPDLRAPATSLRLLAGPGAALDRSELARRLIRGLDRLYAAGLEGDLGPVEEGWRARLEPLGRAVRLETNRGEVLLGELVDARLGSGMLLHIQGSGPRRLPCAEVRSVETVRLTASGFDNTSGQD